MKHDTLDLLEVLLDPDNTDDLILSDGQGQEITFMQIAVIPHAFDGCEKVYCILKPLEKMDDVADDDAFVFRVDETDNGSCLVSESDELKAKEIFDIYYDLMKKSPKHKK